MKDCLSDQERDELLTRLSAESNTIRFSFARLVTRTLQCLKNSNVTIDLLVSLFRECEMDSLVNVIEPTDSIAEVMKKVKEGRCWSFFNYELLENMISLFCQQLTTELNGYISEFKLYCERRLSEVPAGAIMPGEAADKTPLFRVKLDDIFNVDSKLGIFKKVQHKIQQILKKKLFLLMCKLGVLNLLSNILKAGVECFLSLKSKSLLCHVKCWYPMVTL